MMTIGTPLHDTVAAVCACMPTEGYLAAALRADPDRFAANEEPPLDDLLGDPITACLMASDGLQPDAVAAVVRDAQARLGARS